MASEPLPTGLIGGPEKRQIVIVEYDNAWQVKFQQHAKLISEAVGSAALRIEHIGSTSVPGLGAKPIIDILLVVKDSSEESTYSPQLQSAGYVLRVREPDRYEHRMFRTPEKDMHLHVYSMFVPIGLSHPQNIAGGQANRSTPTIRHI